MEFAQGVFVNQALFDALKQQDDGVWKEVGVLSDEQTSILFLLFRLGIRAKEPIATMKENMNKAEDAEQIYITRCKEFLTEIDLTNRWSFASSGTPHQKA